MTIINFNFSILPPYYKYVVAVRNNCFSFTQIKVYRSISKLFKECHDDLMLQYFLEITSNASTICGTKCQYRGCWCHCTFELETSVYVASPECYTWSINNFEAKMSRQAEISSRTGFRAGMRRIRIRVQSRPSSHGSEERRTVKVCCEPRVGSVCIIKFYAVLRRGRTSMRHERFLGGLVNKLRFMLASRRA